MKRIFTLLIMGSMVLGAAAQQFEVKPKTGFVEGASTEFELVVHGWIVNLGEDTLFSWKRIENVMTTNWTSAICDNVTCWSVTTDSNSIIIKEGDSSILDAHFYLANTAGSGSVKLMVWSGSNKQDADTIELVAATWPASLASLKGDKNMRVYPNPTQGNLQLEYATGGVVEVEIYDVLGKKVMNFKHTGFISSYDVSSLPNGLYVIRVNDNGLVSSRTFKKAQ